MTCLENFIGVRGCSGDEPESGLYINDVAGVRTLLSAKIVDEENVTGRRLLQSVIARAYRLAVNDIVSALAGMDYLLRPEFALDVANVKRLNRKLKAGDTFRLDVCLNGISEYEKVIWDKVRTFASGSGTVTIIIKQGSEIKAESFSVEAGENDASIDVEIDRDAKISITSTVDLDFYGSGCECFCSGDVPFWAWLTVRADLDTFACRYRHTLANAFLYRAAIEFAQEMMHTPRMNEEARSAKENAQKLLLELRGGADYYMASQGFKASVEGLYPKAIDQVVNGLKNQIESGKINIFDCERSKIYYVTP